MFKSLIIPAFFEDCVLPFAVRLSVCPSVWPTAIPFYSSIFDARITKSIYLIPLCTQMLVTYLIIFSVFQFLDNSHFSDFIQNCNFSVNYIRNCFNFLVYRGSHMQHISNEFYHVTFRLSSKMETSLEGGGVISH